MHFTERSPFSSLEFRLARQGVGGTGRPAASGTTCQESLTSRTAVVRTRMPGGVGGGSPRGLPLSRFLNRYSRWTCGAFGGGRFSCVLGRQATAVKTGRPRIGFLGRFLTFSVA